MKISLGCLTVAWFALLADAPLAAEPSRNLGVTQVTDEQRVALVVGNAGYKAVPLANPVNDAKDIAAKLRRLGFDVIERRDLAKSEIGATLREFRSKLRPGAVALFFYAGHGVQIRGVNYLPAVDADIASEEDVPTQSLDIGKVLDIMDEGRTRLNLVFLDACRTNPYARGFRAAADGLARINAPSGTIISFATRPGSIALDGRKRNGLYTEHLLLAMDETELPIEQVLKHVVAGVKKGSMGQQEPWMEGSIDGDFCFGPCGGPRIASFQAPASQENDEPAAQPSGTANATTVDIGSSSVGVSPTSTWPTRIFNGGGSMRSSGGRMR